MAVIVYSMLYRVVSTFTDVDSK